MTDLYRMTWQKKNDDSAPVLTGPILKHLESNPYWVKETTLYTHEEALNAAKKWNRLCPLYKHKIINVTHRMEEA